MRNDLDSIIETVRSVISHGLQILVLVIFKDYYLYIIILPVITILNNIIRSVIIDKRYPQYKGNGKLTKADKRDILTRVGALIGNKLGGAVFTSVDSIVISKFLGLVVLAQYTNYYTIFSAVFAIETVKGKKLFFIQRFIHYKHNLNYILCMLFYITLSAIYFFMGR